MSDHGISMICIFSYKNRIIDSFLMQQNKVSEKLCSSIFHGVFFWHQKKYNTAHFKGHFLHTEPVLLNMNVLQVHKINISKTISLTQKCKLNILPSVKQRTSNTSWPWGNFAELLCRAKVKHVSIIYRILYIWEKLDSEILKYFTY